MIRFSGLERICEGTVIALHDDLPVRTLVLDSRKSIATPGAVFFAITGDRHNAHRFLLALYTSGFRQFVVEEKPDVSLFPDANILLVRSSRKALQQIAQHHRETFSIPVIGITGSNGKTILKEWMFQLLSIDFSIVKNPGSYNSQTGVPLSVWQMDAHHQLGIFEAGISKPGEMESLQKIIQPTIGIFTTIGPAHDEGFSGVEQKIDEKLALFAHAEVIIYCSDHKEISDRISKLKPKPAVVLGWGNNAGAMVKMKKINPSLYEVIWMEQAFNIQFPFSDKASVENASHGVAVMLYLNYSPEKIQERIAQLKTIPMRLELKQGINQCQIIDDTYNNDLSGLQISLDFLAGIQKKKSTLILSDILQSGLSDDMLAENINSLITGAGVNTLIGIGPAMCAQKEILAKGITSTFYASTEEFLALAEWSTFSHEVILVKGARIFRFERIVQHLQRKIHGTVMEIDLGAMVHNLNYFKALVQPGVGIMAMVKAFAYGSGSEEVASLLQYHGVDYLGVAYPDEGVDLRKNHIKLPVMVMNPSEESFTTLLMHSLEPEIYSFSLLSSFAKFLNGRSWKIHLKIDTGMHRLGFEEEAFPAMIALLKAHPAIEIASVFSHLAGADEATHDQFTREQASTFIRLVAILKKELTISPRIHLLNSPGILRFPDLQFDMVRLGIGLYGIDPTTTNKESLQPVATLKTVISQIKTIKAGESIGYGRKGNATSEIKIATIALGYADGFSRSFSGGKGSVLINGKAAPVIGNVCMDMTMVDVTNIQASEGDEVIIFGKGLPIEVLAKSIGTIPYEILTGTSERVKRVFFAESI